jgi:hypothetical protein
MKSSLHGLIPFLPFLLSHHRLPSQEPSSILFVIVRVRVTLRLVVYRQSVGLGAKPIETHNQYIFQLNTCGYSPYVTYSLTRIWICRLELLLALASAVNLRFECRGTPDHILLSQIRDSQPRGPGTRIYIPQEQGGPVTPWGTVFPFRCLLRLAGLRWRHSNPPPHGVLFRSSASQSQSQSQSHFMTGGLPLISRLDDKPLENHDQ